jgi:hypothetical protein
VTTRAGLWVDHRKAVVVRVSDDGETTKQIDSNVERHVRYSGGPGAGGSHGSREGTGEDTRERRFEGQLDRYYDEVIACIRDADAILIFGPGEAGGELRKRLEGAGLGARIVGIETSDKMTDRQIAAKVRDRFAE